MPGANGEAVQLLWKTMCDSAAKKDIEICYHGVDQMNLAILQIITLKHNHVMVMSVMDNVSIYITT